jgi:hypothetical protein
MDVVSSLISHTRMAINLDIKLVTYCTRAKFFVLFTNKHGLCSGFRNWLWLQAPEGLSCTLFIGM